MSIDAVRSEIAPFRNIDELNAAHDLLLGRFRPNEDATALHGAIIDFMLAAERAGRFLYHDNERLVRRAFSISGRPRSIAKISSLPAETLPSSIPMRARSCQMRPSPTAVWAG